MYYSGACSHFIKAARLARLCDWSVVGCCRGLSFVEFDAPGLRPYELRALTIDDRNRWMQVLKEASYDYQLEVLQALDRRLQQLLQKVELISPR